MKISKQSFWKVKGPYEIGEGVTVMGRKYVLEEMEPYTNQRGINSCLLHWRGTCNACGATFTFITSRSRFNPLAT